jgi:hypothetical protein
MRVRLVLVLASLTLCFGSVGARATEFGLNDVYAGAREQTADYLRDLGVSWISDHLPRRGIEKAKSKGVSYHFEKIDKLLDQYARKARAKSWFVINIESKSAFTDGKLIGSGKKSHGKYIPDGPISYEAYGKFLRELVKHVNGYVPGWKALYWSVDNEHASLFVEAYCHGRGKAINPACGKDAAMAYARLLEYSSRTIRAVDPQAKIVLGGVPGNTSDEEFEMYWKPILKALQEKRWGGSFDFFDYHNFNTSQNYEAGTCGKNLDFFKKMLAEAGFADKPVLIKAGATHSGWDLEAKNQRLHQKQTEADQAAYLVKRFVRLAAQGSPLILWGTVRETEDREGRHGTYSHNGLVYDGIPAKGQCDGNKEDPCPDPGDGVKKLSYYAFQFFMKNFKDADWSKLSAVKSSDDSVHAYRLEAQGKPVFIVWRDEWQRKTAASTNEPVVLNVGGSLPSGETASVTNSIPSIPSAGAPLKAGMSVESFRRAQAKVANGELRIEVGSSPVYVGLRGS